MTNVSNEPRIGAGTCYCLFAYDIGFSIDLDECERRIATSRGPGPPRDRRRTSRHLEYGPAPLRTTIEGPSFAFGGHRTREAIDVVVYDFGAVILVYSCSVPGPVSGLSRLSTDLYESPLLAADSRAHVERFLELVGPAVTRPRVPDSYEDYVIFQIESFQDGNEPVAESFVLEHASLVARILRANDDELSDGEIRDALSLRMSFSPHDIVIVDWHAALLVDRDGRDVRAVLEFVNAELLEMRLLDRSLDAALDESYKVLSRRISGKARLFGRGFQTQLERFAEWQAESATLFEGVTNSLKLVGDQYLARVYRVASQRFRLTGWDSGILRKLDTLDSAYGKMSDSLASSRLELLEWIIIILIAVSIVIPFLA